MGGGHLAVPLHVGEWLMDIGVLKKENLRKRDEVPPAGKSGVNKRGSAMPWDEPRQGPVYLVDSKSTRLFENAHHFYDIYLHATREDLMKPPKLLARSVSATAAKAANWDGVAPILHSLGVEVDGSLRGYIVSGDLGAVSYLLEQLERQLSGQFPVPMREGMRSVEPGLEPGRDGVEEQPHSFLPPLKPPKKRHGSSSKFADSPEVTLDRIKERQARIKSRSQRVKPWRLTPSRGASRRKRRKNIWDSAVREVTDHLTHSYKNLFGHESVQEWLGPQHGADEGRVESGESHGARCLHFLSHLMMQHFQVVQEKALQVLTARSNEFVRMMLDEWAAVGWLMSCVDSVDAVAAILMDGPHKIPAVLNIFEFCIIKCRPPVAAWSCVFVTQLCEELVHDETCAAQIRTWAFAALRSLLNCNNAMRISNNIYDMLAGVLMVDPDFFIMRCTDKAYSRRLFTEPDALTFLLRFLSAVNRREDWANICSELSTEIVHYIEHVALTMFESPQLLEEQRAEPIELLTELYMMFPKRLEVQHCEATFVNMLITAVHPDQNIDFRLTTVACLFQLLRRHCHRVTFGQLLMDMAVSLFKRVDNYFLYEMVVSNLKDLLQTKVTFNSVVAAVVESMAKRLKKSQRSVDFLLFQALATHPNLSLKDACIMLEAGAFILCNSFTIAFVVIPCLLEIVERYCEESPFLACLGIQLERLMNALVEIDAPGSVAPTVSADAIQELLVRLAHCNNTKVTAALRKALVDGLRKSFLTNKRESASMRVAMMVVDPKELIRLGEAMSRAKAPTATMMASKARVPALFQVDNFEMRRFGHTSLRLMSVSDGSHNQLSMEASFDSIMSGMGKMSPPGKKNRVSFGIARREGSPAKDEDMERFWVKRLLGLGSEDEVLPIVESREKSYGKDRTETLSDGESSHRDHPTEMPPQAVAQWSGTFLGGGKTSRTDLTTSTLMVQSVSQGGVRRSLAPARRAVIEEASITEGRFTIETGDDQLLEVDARGRPIVT